MKISKKLIFTIVMALMVALSALACDKTDDAAPKQDESADANESAGDTGKEEKGDAGKGERISPELPEMDFNGYDFTFLTRNFNPNDPAEADYIHRDIYSEQQNGEPLNDAVYIRNRAIEAKYNINVCEIVKFGELINEVRKTVKAGDSVYDVVMIHLNTEFPAISQEGNLVNVLSMPHMDYTKPWWNHGCIRDLSIGGKLYAVQSDLTIIDNDATSAMIFNKKLLKDFGLENPYELMSL
jgi:ABC-type glycerol-3-phosphate transport system substrate-binding protein